MRLPRDETFLLSCTLHNFTVTCILHHEDAHAGIHVLIRALREVLLNDTTPPCNIDNNTARAEV
jgi:hypothetical protein